MKKARASSSVLGRGSIGPPSWPLGRESLGAEREKDHRVNNWPPRWWFQMGMGQGLRVGEWVRGREQRKVDHNPRKARARKPAMAELTWKNTSQFVAGNPNLVNTTQKSVQDQGGDKAGPSTSFHIREPRASYSSQSEPIPQEACTGPQLLPCPALSSPAHVIWGLQEYGYWMIGMSCEPHHLPHPNLLIPLRRMVPANLLSSIYTDLVLFYTNSRMLYSALPLFFFFFFISHKLWILFRGSTQRDVSFFVAVEYSLV